MKKICTLLSFAGVMVAPNLFAAMTVTLLDNTSEYSKNDGGEFRAVGNSSLDSVVDWGAYTSATSGTISGADSSSWGYNSGLSGSKYFQTFCIEFNQEFSPGVSYTTTVSPTLGTGAAVAIGTAWLYSEFADGGLASYGYNYNYGFSRTSQAGLLQEAIWWLQGEAGGVEDAYVTDAANALGLTASQLQGAEGGKYNYDVYALDLQGGQDQLVISTSFGNSGTPSPVPEPTTILAGALLLLPLGASAVRILRKRQA